MFEFIREGGVGMVVILLIGLPLFFRELLGFGRLVLIKDHKKENLRIDTSSVILGCLAIFCLGAGGTGLGMYYSAKAGLAAHTSFEIVLTGFKESLGNIILSSVIATLILLTHYTYRRLMLSWRAPVVD